VEWDEDLAAPLDALAGGGLIPVLKFRPRGQGEDPAADVQRAAP
jgi:hypothetical protein